mgnify:FL=1
MGPLESTHHDDATSIGGAGRRHAELLVVAALLAPLGGYPIGADVDLTAANVGPSPAHWLGTDHLGRNVAWRLILASRAFLGPGLVAAAVAATLGVVPGAVAGLLGGVPALALRYLTGVLATVPRFVLVLLLLTIYGDSPTHLGIAMGLAYAPELWEAVHGRVDELRRAEFVQASRAHGVPWWRLLFLHLLVGATGGLVARHLVRVFAFAVVVESTLAYLGGFGVQEPWPSWGNMLVFEWGRGFGAAQLAPAVVLMLTVTACASVAGLVGGARHVD